MSTDQISICKSCGVPGHDKFCKACGQKLVTERLSMHGILHEMFHYFTILIKALDTR